MVSASAGPLANVGALANPEEDGTTNLCTVTLVRTPGGPETPAHVLTAGHCIETLNSRARVIFGIYDGGKWLELKVSSVAYSRVLGDDVALLKLEASKAELARSGLDGLAISEASPLPGDELRLVGVPGAQSPEQPVGLRVSSCVHEGWTSAPDRVKAIRHRCSDFGGVSGGPLLDAKSGAIVAVHSFGPSLEEGTAIGAAGYRALVSAGPGLKSPALNGSSEVRGAGKCFDSNGDFDHSAEGCSLAPVCADDDLDCLERQCVAGVANSCVDFGILSGGIEALEPLRRGCELGDPYGCAEYYHRFSDQPHPVETLERSCESGTGQSCFQLALRTEDGERAKLLLERACGQYHPAGCGSLGLALESEGKRVESLAALAHGCGVFGDLRSCLLLAKVLRGGDGEERATAAGIYNKSCIERSDAESFGLVEAGVCLSYRDWLMGKDTDLVEELKALIVE